MSGVQVEMVSNGILVFKNAFEVTEALSVAKRLAVGAGGREVNHPTDLAHYEVKGGSIRVIQLEKAQ